MPLYLGRRYASPSSYIVELAQDESEDLLDELWSHATQEKFVWTQVWTPKDTIIWDKSPAQRLPEVRWIIRNHERCIEA